MRNKRLWSACGVILVLLACLAGFMAKNGSHKEYVSTSSDPAGRQPSKPSISDKGKGSPPKSKPRSSAPGSTNDSDDTRAPKAPLLGENGRLTSSAARNLGLSDENTGKINRWISDFRNEGNRLVAAQAKLIESDSESETWRFSIPALPDKGSTLRQSLLDKLNGALDRRLAGEIYEGILFEQEGQAQALAGYGKYDAEIVFRPGEKAEGQDRNDIAVFEYFDPDTGKRVLSSEMTREEFIRQFGNVFDFSAEKENGK